MDRFFKSFQSSRAWFLSELVLTRIFISFFRFVSGLFFSFLLGSHVFGFGFVHFSFHACVFEGGLCFCVTQSSKAVQFRSKQFSLAVFFFWILDFPTTLSILSRGFFSVLLFSYCWLVWFVVVCRVLVSLSLFLDSVSFVFFRFSLSSCFLFSD